VYVGTGTPGYGEDGGYTQGVVGWVYTGVVYTQHGREVYIQGGVYPAW